MNHPIPAVFVMALLMALLLCCGVTASASEAVVVNDSVGAGLPAETGSSEKTGPAEQMYMTLSADREAATTSLRSAPILISAELDRAGQPVPDGTPVEFAISSGSGSLSGATTTTGGVATVRLSSTTVGTVTVSASSGSVSADISARFRVQPKKAVVKVATVGTLASATTIGSLLASLSYPVSGYGISSGGVSPSGVAGRATTTLAASVEKPGEVVLALLDVGGITAGEFATLNFQVADGYLPLVGDFSVNPAASVTAVVDNAALPGIAVVVTSFTLR